MKKLFRNFFRIGRQSRFSSSGRGRCGGLRRLFDVNHLFGHAPVDGDILAVDEVILFHAEKEAHAGDVFGVPHPSRGVLCVVFGSQRFVVVILNPARSDGVDRDVLGCQR